MTGQPRSNLKSEPIEFEWSDNGVRYWQQLCDRVFAASEKRCSILEAITTADGLAMTNKALAAQVSEALDDDAVSTQKLIGHLAVFEQLGIVSLVPRWDNDHNSVILRSPYVEDWLTRQESKKGAPVAAMSQGARLIVEYVGWNYRPASSTDESVFDSDDRRSLLPLKGTLYAHLLTATGRVEPGNGSIDEIGPMPRIELEIGSLESVSDAAYEQLTDLDFAATVPERGDDPIGDYWHNLAVVGRIEGFEWTDSEKVPIEQTARRFSNSWIAAPMELYPRQQAGDVDDQRITDDVVEARMTEFPPLGSDGIRRRGQAVEFDADTDTITFGTFVRDRINPNERSFQYGADDADQRGDE